MLRLVILMTLVVGCTDSSSSSRGGGGPVASDSSTNTASSTATATATSASGQKTLPDALAVSGSLALGTDLGDASAEGRAVQLVDDSGLVVAQATTNAVGAFQIALSTDDLALTSFGLQGSRTLQVQALFLVDGQAQQDAAGVKQQLVIDADDVVQNGDGSFELDAGAYTARKVGAIVGKLTLETGEDATGTDVYVPGTTFVGKTDASGHFILGFLPPGAYTVRADRDGYGSLEWQAVAVKRATTTHLGDAKMSIATGPQVVSLSLQGGATIALDPGVTLAIALKGATKFRVSQLSDFRDTVFRPVDATADAMTVPFQISGSDGPKSIYLEAADSDGLSVSTRLDIVLDTALPVAPEFTVRTADAKPGYAASVSPKIYPASCDDVAKLFVTEDAGVTPSPEQFTIDCAAAKSTGELVTISGGEGTKTLRVWALDAAGQVSAAARSGQVVLDTTASALAITPSAGSYNEAVEVKITAGSNVTIHYTFDLSDPDASSPEVKADGKLLLVGDGTLKFRAIDHAGNVSAVASRSYIVDRDKPLLGSIAITSGKALINTTTIGLTLSAQAATWMRVGESLAGVNTATWIPYATSRSHTLTDTTNGARKLFAMFKDDAGNAIGGDGEYQVAFTLDTQPPLSSAVTLLTPESPTGAFNTPLAWSEAFDDEPGVSFEVQVYSNSAFTGSATRTMTTTDTTVLINPPLDDAGTYYWRVRPIDAAGNPATTWAASGESKKFTVRQFATDYLSRRDVNKSGDEKFGKALTRLADGRIAVSALQGDFNDGGASCTACGVVHVLDSSGETIVDAFSALLPASAGFGQRMTTCDLVDGGQDEIVVTAPGKAVTVDGAVYNNAGAVYIYDATTLELIKAIDNPMSGTIHGYPYCRNYGESPCREYGYPSNFMPIDYTPYAWSSRFFGWDVACVRSTSGADRLAIGEPAYAASASSQPGRVHIMRLSGSSVVTDQTLDYASATWSYDDSSNNTLFGTAVAHLSKGRFTCDVGGSTDAAMLVVGAPYKNLSSSYDDYGRGALAVYKWNGTQYAYCTTITATGADFSSYANFGGRLTKLGDIDDDASDIEELAASTLTWGYGTVKIYGSITKSIKKSESFFGYSVTPVGDWTGANLTSIAIGAPGQNVVGQYNAGQLSIYAQGSLSDAGTAARVLQIAPNFDAAFGSAAMPLLADPTSIHNDFTGTSTLLVTAPGRRHKGGSGIVHTIGVVSLAPTLPTRLSGGGPGAEYGRTLAAVADIDNDDVSDFVIGSPGARCQGLPSGVLSIYSVAARLVIRDACPGAGTNSRSIGEYLAIGPSTGTLLYAYESEDKKSTGNRLQPRSFFDLINPSPGNAPSTFDHKGVQYISKPFAWADFNDGGMERDFFVVGDPTVGSNKGQISIRKLNGTSFEEKCTYTLAAGDGALFGTSGDFVRDANSDTVRDLAVGAPAYPVTGSTKGRVYLLKGRISQDDLVNSATGNCDGPNGGTPNNDVAADTIDTIDSNDAAITTELGRNASSGFGSLVVGLPDLDGGGGADSFLYVANTNLAAGDSSVIPEWFVLSYTDVGNVWDVVYHEVGLSGSMLGGFVRVLPDIDGDGKAELAVSCPGCQGRLGNTGQVKIMSGGKLVTDPTNAVVQMLFNPDDQTSNFGVSFEYGDMTGDGIRDFVVGANKFDTDEYADAGAVYVFAIQPIQD